MGRGRNKKGKKVRCHNCGYTWKTKTTLQYVSCPNCRNKTEAHKKYKHINRFNGDTK